MHSFSCSIACAILLHAGQAAAQADTPAEASQSIHINGIRNPELKSYRVMAAGLDAFDEYHALAPQAHEVRFTLIADRAAPADAMQDLSLRIAGNDTSISLPLADDGSFALPRSAQADRDDADLITNKKKGNYRWQPSIHSDNVPAGMRRLGDLRLQCQVAIAIARKEIPFWVRALVGTLLRTTDWCSAHQLKMGTHSALAVSGATLVANDRRIALVVENNGYSFLAPVGDTRYPDDALIELQYRQDAVAPTPDL